MQDQNRRNEGSFEIQNNIDEYFNKVELIVEKEDGS